KRRRQLYPSVGIFRLAANQWVVENRPIRRVRARYAATSGKRFQCVLKCSHVCRRSHKTNTRSKISRTNGTNCNWEINMVYIGNIEIYIQTTALCRGALLVTRCEARYISKSE